MLYKKDKLIRETAEKRLNAIRDFTELGSGFKIAIRDLEIRGAGNLLGERQSGHMELIGYDLYCKLLNDAIREKRGFDTAEDLETSVDITVDAYIPDSYIMNEYQKIDIYKRIASITSQDEKNEMTDELTDRFGILPESVINLLDVALIRALAREVFITEIREVPGAVRLTVYEKANYDVSKLPGFITSFNGLLAFKNTEKPYFILAFGKGKKPEGRMFLALIRDFLTRIKEELVMGKEAEKTP